MKTSRQAQGLQDWARYKKLEGERYLDEDEAWELNTLKKDLGIPEPPKKIRHPRPWTYEQYMVFTHQKWSANVWSEEIVYNYKANLLMAQFVGVAKDD